MIQNILDRKGTEVITIHANDTVQIAADGMRRYGVAALVVKNGDEIRGLVSERDITLAVSRHGNGAPSLAVSNIVSQAMIRVAPNDGLKRAMTLMTNNHVRHLLVIDDSKLVGIVSIGDIVKQRLEDLETETNVLRDVYLAVR
jgi:CBS domain-containing protein